MEREINVDAAVNFYKKQLVHMRNYNKRNSEVINKRSREYFQKIKADPEKYKLYLEKKKDYYILKKKKKNDTESETEIDSETDIGDESVVV